MFQLFAPGPFGIEAPDIRTNKWKNMRQVPQTQTYSWLGLYFSIYRERMTHCNPTLTRFIQSISNICWWIYIYMFFFKGFIPIHSHWYTTRLFKHIYPLLPVIQPTFPGRTNPGNMGSVEIHQSLARIHGFCIYITNTKPWMINPFSTGFKWFLWEKYYLTILSVGITTIYEGNLDPMTWRLAHVGF